MGVLKDLPSLRKNLEKIDKKRMMRLREAKDSKDFKLMLQSWSAARLHPTIITNKQRLAIHLLADFVHNFSYGYVATRLGVTQATLTKWRNDPTFLRELCKEIDRRQIFMKVHAYRNVNRAIMRGSMKDTWQYLKLIGDMKEHHEIVDRTGERELSDDELREEIKKLAVQVATSNIPSEN